MAEDGGETGADLSDLSRNVLARGPEVQVPVQVEVVRGLPALASSKRRPRNLRILGTYLAAQRSGVVAEA